MKRLLIIAGVLIAIAYAMPLIIQTGEGKSLLESFGENTVSADDEQNEQSGSSSQSFYKWQDENGTWHYSDKPRSDGGNMETVTVNPDANLLPGIQSAEESENVKNDQKVSNPGEAETISPIPMTVPPGKVADMIRDAKNLQNTVEQRIQSIDNSTQNK